MYFIRMQVILAKNMSMTKKNIVKYWWKPPNQYWDILVLTGQSTETGRKIGSGGMRLGKNVKKTHRLREMFTMDRREHTALRYIVID
jgi:hypothetical protein